MPGLGSPSLNSLLEGLRAGGLWGSPFPNWPRGLPVPKSCSLHGVGFGDPLLPSPSLSRPHQGVIWDPWCARGSRRWAPCRVWMALTPPLLPASPRGIDGPRPGLGINLALRRLLESLSG